MAIDVKMGVSGVAQFKQSMNQAQQSVKTLDAELKLNEKQLKASGDKETYMQQKSKLLQQQIAAQNKVVKEGQNALAAMTKSGVDPASKAYQQLQQRVLEAQSALLDMEGDLASVGQTAPESAQKTDLLTNSLNGINKKVSFDAVLNGIGKITSGMEAAARKVAALATDVWDTMAMAASWADNENTLATMYGIDVETLQRMQGASRTIDTTVEAIIKARQKLKQNMSSDSQEIADMFILLGVDTGRVAGKDNEYRFYRDWEDVFWDAGEALKNYGDEIERDVLAQKMFGRSWMELMPLFEAGRETYQKTLDDQSIVTEENVDKLQALDDALQKLDQDYQATKNTILAELAPAFATVADTVSGLIREFNAYLQTDEGQEKLAAMGQAVTDLFTGLADVDFETAIDTASGILDTITGSLEWILDNKDGLVAAIQGIGGAFLALKAAEIIGTLVQSAAALKTLLGSAAGAAGSAGADGTAVGLLFANLSKAVPILAGVAVAATPAVSASDEMDSYYDKNGRVTTAGRLAGLPETQAEFDAWSQEAYDAWAATHTWQGNGLVDQLQTQEQNNAARHLHKGAVTGTASEESMQAQGLEDKQRALENYIAGLQTSGIPGMENLGSAALNDLAQRIMDLGLGAGWAMDFASMEALRDALRREEKAAAQWGRIAQEEQQTFAEPTDQMKGAAEYYWMAFKARGGDSEGQLWDQIVAPYLKDREDLAERMETAIAQLTEADNWEQLALPEDWWQEPVEVETEPELVDDAAEILQKQMNGVTLTVDVVPGMDTSDWEHSGHGGSFANGLPFVPFDGYIAELHKGERVVPASQNKTYTANSNLYVESMIMNNDTDAQGLAAAMAAENRRIRAGFGS